MQAFVERAVAWFALPEHGLASVFVVAFLSATLLPMGSEPVVFGFIKLNPDMFWLTIAIATAANTLGGLVNYAMGRGAKYAVAEHRGTRYLGWLERFGPPVLLLAWLPVVGDPLAALAGWLKLRFWPCVAYMAAGKLLRYLTVTAALLWVPSDWWGRLLRLLGA